MAVLVEAISVIIRRNAIVERFVGGWDAFQHNIPNGTFCKDDDLVRVGFMTPNDTRAYVSELESNGLIFQRGDKTVDMAVVDQLHGFTVPAPWLEFGTIQFKEMKIKACWLAGTTLKGVGFPAGWKYEKSLSQRPGFATEESAKERLIFLRIENGTEVYLDLDTGKEMFVGRPDFESDTEEALFTKLERMCSELLNIEDEIQHYTSIDDEHEVNTRLSLLKEGYLPELKRIAEGPGSNMAFSHYAYGLVLRNLCQLDVAEVAFRKANDLQPGTINILLELVRCLGEQNKHREALPFAREGVALEPDNAGALGNLAISLIKCGERDEARKTIDYAISLDPDDRINCYIRDNFEDFLKG